LHVLIADDQIPPADIPAQKFREHFFSDYGDSNQNRLFMEQCLFMGEVVQALRDSGYRLTTARTYKEATKVISEGNFDLAIIDLGWYMDFALPENQRPAAGWSLCDQLDERDKLSGTRTPQIVFSSRFPTEPVLSHEAARRQKLPLFKEATPVVRNSLMAAVGFVEASLTAQRFSDAKGGGRFKQELEEVAVSFFRESLHDYRRWALLTLVFVAISLALLVAGVVLAYTGIKPVATVSSITSLVTGTISALLYKRLASAQKAVETARREVLKKLEARATRDG
jgi:hypothetical protein